MLNLAAFVGLLRAVNALEAQCSACGSVKSEQWVRGGGPPASLNPASLNKVAKC